MFNKVILPVFAILTFAGLAVADEVDAVINQASRAFTKGKQKESPDALVYGKLMPAKCLLSLP
jgi:hypothetical protein